MSAVRAFLMAGMRASLTCSMEVVLFSKVMISGAFNRSADVRGSAWPIS